MELGQKIRAARLEAGLSQRELCGDTITRNMLSLIENGSARPSMDTLQILAARLHKTVGYFLEEGASCNEHLMQALRQAKPEQVAELLKDYVSPDPVFDRERYFLESNAYLILSRQALQEEKKAYAQALLEKAMLKGNDLRADEVLSKHADWADEISHKYSDINENNIDEIIKNEIGIVFSKVLEHAGVYKRDEKGLKSFLKFTESVK